MHSPPALSARSGLHLIRKTRAMPRRCGNM